VKGWPAVAFLIVYGVLAIVGVWGLMWLWTMAK